MKQKLVYINSLFELYEVITIAALAIAICLTINDISGIFLPGPVFVITSIIWVFLMRFIVDNKDKLMTYLILAGVLILLFIITGLFGTNPVELITDATDYFVSGIYSQQEQIGLYGFLFGMGISFLAGLLSYFINKVRLFREITGGILFLMVLMFGFFQVELSKITLLFLLFYMLVNLADVCGKFSFFALVQNSKQKENGKNALYLLPFCLFMACVILILPSKKDPIQWTAFKTAFHITVDMVEDMIANIKISAGANTQYNIAFSGYSDSGNLTGEITEKQSTQLQFNGKQSESNVYLIGSVYDTYTGKGWEKTNITEKSLTSDYQLDYYELFFAMKKSKADLNEIRKNIHLITAEILFRDIRTNTLFYPQKTFYISGEKKNPYNDGNANILFKKSYNDGLHYRFRYLEINYDSETIRQLFRDMEGFHYNNTSISQNAVLTLANEDISKMENTFKIADIENINQVLSNRANKIKKDYCVLPETVPERVYQLANEITKNYDTVYDKSKAIEEYLNQYTYTTTPDKATEGVDFVDDFLFETKEGYCTYFATAMAVLCRASGIPARYVEGFCLDYSHNLGNDCYEIKSTDAHAWCEVYIEGAGWIPFEPTAGRADSRYKPWGEDKSSGNTFVTQGVPPFTEHNNNDKVKTQLERKSWNIMPAIIILSYLVGFTILFIGLYYLILQRQRTRRYKQADYNDRVLLQFIQILKLLELYTKKEVNNQTVTELFENIGQVMSLNGETTLKMTNIYIRLRYSNGMALAEDVALYEEISKRLETTYLSGCNILKRLDYRMFRTAL